jgi:tetratricopeptide (TPR) repeat protein
MRHGARSWWCCWGLILALAGWGEEYVYEGRSAAEWIKELKPGIGGYGPGAGKAQHALAVLGKDALPGVMGLLKDPDVRVVQAALQVLDRIKLDEEGIATVLPLLKDPSFEVRRGAVKILAKYAPAEKIVAAALQGALQDRDKAVAEAAEQALAAKAKVDEDANLRKRFEKFLAEAKAGAMVGDLEDAKLKLGLAKGLGLDDPETQMRLKAMDRMIAETAGQKQGEGKRKGEDKFGVGEFKGKDPFLQKAKDEDQRRQQLEVLLKQARILADKGDLDNAQRILREAVKLFPDDERAAEFLKRFGAKLQDKGNGKGAPDKDPNKKPAPPQGPEGQF